MSYTPNQNPSFVMPVPAEVTIPLSHSLKTGEGLVQDHHFVKAEAVPGSVESMNNLRSYVASVETLATGDLNSTKARRSLTLADGREATVTVRSTHNGDAAFVANRMEEQNATLLNLDVATFGQKQVKRLEKITSELSEISGYDREMTPILKVSGDERRRLESEKRILENEVALNRVTIAEAMTMQNAAREYAAAEREAIETAARQKAFELHRQGMVDQLAKTYARQMAKSALLTGNGN